MNVLCIVLILNVLASCNTQDPGPTVTTSHGTLVGDYLYTRGGRRICGFLGVPFAKPPVGDLRFEPPEPPDPWNEVRPAAEQPPRCFQFITIQAPGMTLVTSEDCLYLNVYTPNVFSHPLLPVLFYIFGGVFKFGGAAENTPEFLLDEDMVFVSINHRLGLFGFLSTGDEVVPGNMGVKDVVMALKWVRDNIRYFGGDPDKVTIYGESSGAAIVHLLMTFADDQGLFHAAIISGGSALNPWAIRPPEEVPKIKNKLAELSDCPSDSKALVSCLKSKNASETAALYDELMTVMNTKLSTMFSNYVPALGPVLEADCVKDRIITANPWRRNTNIPLLVGLNSKEALFILMSQLLDETGRNFTASNSVFDEAFPLWMNYQNSQADGSQVPTAMREFYLNNQPISRDTLSETVDALSDAYFVYGVYEALLRDKSPSTYLYYFDYIGANTFFPFPKGTRVGASHVDELYLIFPHPEVPFQYPTIVTEEDVKLSKTMIKLIYNFMTFLDPTPNSDFNIKWRPFSEDQSYLHIKQDELVMETRFLPERMKFWQSQPFPFRDDSFGAPTCLADLPCEVT